MIIDANINNTKKYYMRKKENILVQVVIQTIKKKILRYTKLLAVTNLKNDRINAI